MRKTKTQISFVVTAKLIRAFVFATQSLYFLNPKFQASSHFLLLYSLVCIGPVRKPECWFSHDAAHLGSERRGADQLHGKLIWGSVFAFAKSRFSHEAAQIESL